MHSATKTIRAIAIAGVLMASRNSLAQDTASPKGEVVLVKLAPLTYPPLARQTRISGDVQVVVEVRPDGGVATTTVIQGHPLLAQAALDSAKQSQFECKNCPEEGLSLRLVYTFEISFEPEPCPGDKSPSSAEQPYPRVSRSRNHITVIDHSPQICDPREVITKTKVRSARCLYLWHCRVSKITIVE